MTVNVGIPIHVQELGEVGSFPGPAPAVVACSS